MAVGVQITKKGNQFMAEQRAKRGIQVNKDGIPNEVPYPHLPALFYSVPNLPDFAADHPLWELYMEEVFYYLLDTGQWSYMQEFHSHWTFALFSLGYLSVGE
jgi:hypothetical protein